jgi:hypothetical protein
MDDKVSDAKNHETLQTVTDDEIVTERVLPRRSFLRSTGAVLAGAAGLVAGVRAAGAANSGRDDPKPAPPPDAPPPDPDKKREDPDKRERDREKRREDPDKPGDRKRPADPDKRPADPDKPPDQARF